jgi:DNA-binding transcriptional regulator YdaS (Cro superfamily)
MTDLEFMADSLQRALAAVGLDDLAARLNVSPHLVQTWSQGQAKIPERTFMLLVDLLLDVSPSDPLPGLQ